MTISVRISDEDAKLIKDYAKAHGISLSEFARCAMLERIEDDLDIILYEKAKKEYDKNSKAYSIDEVEIELGL